MHYFYIKIILGGYKISIKLCLKKNSNILSVRDETVVDVKNGKSPTARLKYWSLRFLVDFSSRPLR